MDIPENRKPRPEPDAVDLRQPLLRLKSAILHHKLLILLTMAATTALTILYMRLRPPVYEAETVIRCELDHDKSRDDFYDRWNVFRKNDLMSEASLIISGAPLLATVRKLDLRWDDVYHPLSSQVVNWWERSPIGKKYREIKAWFVTPDPPPWEPPPEEREFAKVLMDFKAGVSFQPVPEASVGSIRVQGPTPRVAEIADAIATCYIDLRRERLEAEARKAYDALTPQVEAAQRELGELDQRVQRMREEHDILFNFEKYQQVLTRQGTNQQNILEMRARISNAEKEYATLEALFAKESVELVSGKVAEVNPLKESIRERILSHEVALIQARKLFAPDQREVTSIEDTILELNGMLNGKRDMLPKAESISLNQTRETLRQNMGNLQAKLAGDRAALVVFEAAEAQFSAELKSVPEKQRLMQEMLREYTLADNKYRGLLDKQTQAKLSMDTVAATAPAIQVVGPATRPTRPVWPDQKMYIAAALFIGALMGIVAAYIRDLIENRVRSYDLEDGRGLAPLYASVFVGSNGRVARLRPREKGRPIPALASRDRLGGRRGTVGPRPPKEAEEPGSN